MRRGLLILLVTIGVLWSQAASACILKISPPTFEAKVGDVISFHLERYITHKRCVLPIEETKITVKGGTIVEQGTWKEGNPDTIDFKVRFDQAGEGVVRIERNCPREGLISIEAKGRVVEPSTTQEASAQVEETPQAPATPSSPPTQEIQATVLKESATSITHLTESVNLRLWYIFFIVGIIAFLSNLSNYRRPLLFLSVIFLGFYLGGCPEPVGAIFYLLSNNRGLLLTALILFAIPIAMSFVWGRAFCGWICPLGAVQELIHRSQGMLRCYYGLPSWIDRPLKWVKFLILFGFGYLTWKAGENVFSHYEPFKVLFNFTGTTLTISILAVTLLASILTSRPFCRYLCPLGAIFKITAPFSRFKVKLDEESCVECGLCSRGGVCPISAIRCSGNSNRPLVDHGECIACLECTNICKKGSLRIGR